MLITLFFRNNECSIISWPEWENRNMQSKCEKQQTTVKEQFAAATLFLFLRKHDMLIHLSTTVLSPFKYPILKKPCKQITPLPSLASTLLVAWHRWMYGDQKKNIVERWKLDKGKQNFRLIEYDEIINITQHYKCKLLSKLNNMW